MTATPTPSIAVFGGGIAGLTAAHELARRGFGVTLLEAADRFGGKARSVPGGSGTDRPAPGEHGFRFFPAYYQHVIDSMGRIPTETGTVRDHLVETEATLIAEWGGELTITPSNRSTGTEGWLAGARPTIGGGRVPAHEVRFFLRRLGVLLTSGENRRRHQWEHTAWWDFVRADEMSPAYRKHLAHATRALVALRPRRASARTIGLTYAQLLRGRLDPRLPAERVLDGPTSEVWIEPWVDHLEELGVELRTGAPVVELGYDGRRITGLTVETDGATDRIEADYYVAAVPVEALRRLVTPAIARRARSLARLDRLETAWMNGIQFYLDRDVPVVEGHGVLADAPWALTVISQGQFWADGPYDLERSTDGAVTGVLSVIVAEWETPGASIDKPAKACTPTEIKREVWHQLEAHLNTADRVRVDADDLRGWSLDPAIVPTDGGLENRAPLFVNTVGSLPNRPDPATEIDNLVVAADYVRTTTDLATMEGANESARRAVNAILDRLGSTATRCRVWELEEPTALAPFKRQDAVAYRLGLPHPGASEIAARQLLRRLVP